MNYNILSYLIYISITIYIIYYVGKSFHRNGRIFILQLFQHNEQMADTTNNLLLIAYYLFNIGYAVLKISMWTKVPDLAGLIATISSNTGLLVIILALTHYFNITVLYILSKKNVALFNSKT